MPILPRASSQGRVARLGFMRRPAPSRKPAPFRPRLREPYHIPGGSGREVGAQSGPGNLPTGRLGPRGAPESGMGEDGRVMRTHTRNRTFIPLGLLIADPRLRARGGTVAGRTGWSSTRPWTASSPGPCSTPWGSAGVEVLPKFDVESTKTVGLTKLILAESANPRCDLFWNNEILNTLRLRQKGLLEPFQPAGRRRHPGRVQGQGRHLVRLRRAGPRAAGQHAARRRRGPAHQHPRPDRPPLEGADRPGQAALRHDGHACRLPLRRLGRRQGAGLLRGASEQRGPGPLGQQAGRPGGRIRARSPSA